MRINQSLAFAAIAFTAAVAGLAGPCASTASAAGFNFGHIYRPASNGNVYEIDADLNIVGSFAVPGVTSATGATFGADGNLVFVCRRAGAVKVIEVDATGQTMREYDTGETSLNAVSYIDYDPVTQRYAFADNSTVTILDRNLDFVGTVTGHTFQRASGVAWAPDGDLYVTDNLGDGLVRFNPDLSYASTVMFGVDTGIDLVGNMVYATNGSPSIWTYNTQSGATSEIITSAGFSNLVNMLVLPSGDFLMCSSSGSLSTYSPSGAFLDFLGLPFGGDGMAYFVPGPGAAIGLILVGLLRHPRRRSCEC